jgi:tetratricopeptide (TPR) repeat protein
MRRPLTGCGSEKPISFFRKFLFSSAALAAILFSIYSNSFDCGWHLDDFHSITDNPNIQLKNLTWEGISKSLHSDLNHPEKLYRPMAGLTFALNYFVSGTDPASYHLVNLLIHWLSSFFLFLFLYQTLNLPSFHQKYASSAYSVALLSATLWAINPVQTQSVTYIVQRMASLAGMFYIMSMYFYAMGRTALDRKRRLLYLVLAFTAFVLSFGSKENAALLPLSILLYEGFVVQADMGSWIKRNKTYVLMALVVVLTLSILYVYYRRGSFLSFLNDYEGRPFTLVQRLLTQPRVILFYLSLILYPLPDRMSIAHSFDISTSLFHPLSTLFAILFMAGAVVLAVPLRKKYPILSFSFLFFLVNHLLESSIFPLELVFEHRNYIPSMVVFFPVAMGICHLFKRYASALGMRTILAAFIVLLLVGLGHATYVRNFAWKTEGTLWADASMKAPDQFRPHHNLGVVYHKQGRLQEAISEFEQALQSQGLNRRTEMVVTYYHLGRAYHQLGELQKSKGFYEKALQMDANLSHALGGVAVLYGLEGNTGTAFVYLERALKADSENPYVNFNMGLHYMKQGEMDRAEPHFKKAAVDEGLKGSAYLYLGVISKQRGQLGQASTHLKASAAANPKDVTPHLHLLEVYHAAGLERMSLQEGEILSEMIGRDEALFRQTVDLIVAKGGAMEVRLSNDVIIPILYQVLTKRADAFKTQLSYLKKVLDKDSKIE